MWAIYSCFLCLEKPHKPHHGGGLIFNPEFKHDIEGWTLFGHGAMKEGRSQDGNRTAEGKLIRGGMAIAKHGCWSLLKGGMVARFSGPVEILFECKNTKVDTWVDNVSLQQFTHEEWRSHQQKSLNKVRKTDMRFNVTCNNNTPLKGANVTIKQITSSFPFGCGINHHILTSEAYQNWFASRFKFATFTNEMKWYSTERAEDKENYTISDSMLRFAKENGIAVRGHNIFWDNPKQQPSWVKSLSRRALQKAAAKRINSVVKRYSGKLIAWDVMNENLHFRFYEEKLGENASAEYYAEAYQLDPRTRMFMNEYNTIENTRDVNATAVNYVKKLEQILSYPGNKGMLAGIGVQGHFGPGHPNLVYMRSALDILGSTGLPIWLTEVDVERGPNQELFFEEILREGYSHPAVEGIIIFAGPEAAGFNVTTLAATDFKNTPAGDVVDKLMQNWKTGTKEITTDTKGFAEVSLFHGDYNVIVTVPKTNDTTTVGFTVTGDNKGAGPEVFDIHMASC
ncbi:hypothetical protein Tsubulata_029497 [Turnera subulata]|uniref:GH10 domain-containing protein n=1 Tax=Turnera subulata TaxID=218843 RepID=A0A9Q0FIW2_9ROSI|nr:hypothetical protein Tsubulata_029497 [Turnera subulata]